MRFVAAASALLALASLWSVERAHVRHDLQLAAESSARPGELIAVRALLFRDVDATEGPTLVSAPAELKLRDAAGRELARRPLRATPLDTLDTELLVPSFVGDFVLEASAELEGERLVAKRALHVAVDAPRARARGREAGALQQLSIGRVVPKSAEPAPSPFRLRVLGGACVPDRPCDLLVWVGEPAAAIAVRSGPSAELTGAPEPANETEGLVAFTVTVRGPEAELTLQAKRRGELVAERAVRLPVGLGEVALRAPASLIDGESATLEIEPPPGRDFVVADLFVEGRWRASRVLPTPASPSRLTLGEPLLTPGVVRVQARADRFSAEGSGQRALYLRSPGEDDAHALAELARRVAEEAEDPGEARAFAAAAPSFALANPQRTAAYMLASLEVSRFPVPPAVSGRPAQLNALDRTKVRMRFGVAGALVVSALALALSIARRGLSAADEAEAILQAARDDGEASDRRARYRGRASVLLFVLAVVSAFLAAALLIAAKPLWF